MTKVFTYMTSWYTCVARGSTGDGAPCLGESPPGEPFCVTGPSAKEAFGDSRAFSDKTRVPLAAESSLPARGFAREHLGAREGQEARRRSPCTTVHFKGPFSRAGPCKSRQKETLSSQLRPHYLNIALACQILFQPVLLSPPAWDLSKPLILVLRTPN